ncbi:hypothetical protein BC834DRAFT_148175 [Gloeopeniophorella convolvens]|nr:hypothetical protein BC834DRAFT_148175 [Gloeopeniophorella convolvens]
MSHQREGDHQRPVKTPADLQLHEQTRTTHEDRLALPICASWQDCGIASNLFKPTLGTRRSFLQGMFVLSNLRMRSITLNLVAPIIMWLSVAHGSLYARMRIRAPTHECRGILWDLLYDPYASKTDGYFFLLFHDVEFPRCTIGVYMKVHSESSRGSTAQSMHVAPTRCPLLLFRSPVATAIDIDLTSHCFLVIEDDLSSLQGEGHE